MARGRHPAKGGRLLRFAVAVGTFSMAGGEHDVVAVSRWTTGTNSVIADAVRVTKIS